MDYKIEDVEIEITNVCSHKCPYCYNGDDSLVNPYFSNFDTLCAVIQKMSEYGAKNFILLGGDPVVYPHIVELMKYIKYERQCRVTLMSNTLEFKIYSIDEVASYIDEIQFTLHATNPEEHEAFCKAKPGLLMQIIDKLKILQSYKVEINIAINIIPQTYNKIYDMIDFICKKGICISKIYLQRILPCGRATDSNEFNVTKKEIDVMFGSLEKIEKDFGVQIILEDPFPYCYVQKEYHKYLTGCQEGISRIAVRGDGRVVCCSAFNSQNLGNVLTDTYESFWINSEYFNSIRNGTYLTNKKCSNCEYRLVCKGGCPVQYMISENRGNNFFDKFE